MRHYTKQDEKTLEKIIVISQFIQKAQTLCGIVSITEMLENIQNNTENQRIIYQQSSPRQQLQASSLPDFPIKEVHVFILQFEKQLKAGKITKWNTKRPNFTSIVYV